MPRVYCFKKTGEVIARVRKVGRDIPSGHVRVKLVDKDDLGNTRSVRHMMMTFREFSENRSPRHMK